MSAPAPTLERLSAINADGSRRTLIPADVHGRFITARRMTYAVLILIYVAMPFVRVGNHPAMQFDIDGRSFYLFGSVFNAQDTWRGVFLLLAIGSTLFFVTAWHGRVWCGWACPQTVFLEGVYRRIERFIEGPKEERMRAMAGPMTARRVVQSVSKHGAFLLVSFLLANVACAFFVSLPSLATMVRTDPRQNITAFSWVMAFTAILYFNFAWFREQLCIVICPYGRLQSVMQDTHSIGIGYDKLRGEPRGKSTRAERAGTAQPVTPKGDCVDCLRCVAVCPTGIDIRNGTQLECIGCAQCIDACDDVMTRLNRPKGLVRYDSLAHMEGKPSRVLRTRLLLYVGLVAAAFTALGLTGYFRTPFEFNLVRLSSAPYIIENGTIRNQYELHLVNKNPVETTFHVSISTPSPTTIQLPTPDVHVASLGHYRIPIFVASKMTEYPGPFEFQITVKDDASGQTRTMPARFLGPPKVLAR